MAPGLTRSKDCNKAILGEEILGFAGRSIWNSWLVRPPREGGSPFPHVCDLQA